MSTPHDPSGPAANGDDAARDVNVDLEIIVGDDLDDCKLVGGYEDVTDLFDGFDDDLEAALPAPEGVADAELARKDETIAQLQGMLAVLKPLGIELGETQEALDKAEARASDSERKAASLDRRLKERERELARLRATAEKAVAAREARKAAREAADTAASEDYAAEVDRLQDRIRQLERKGLLREGVLSRERKRHATTREKLAEKKKLASERWAEIRKLRAAKKKK